MSTEVTYEIERADLFRAYARIMDAPRKIDGAAPLMAQPSSICRAAAQCLRLVADAIDRRDPHLPKDWLDEPSASARRSA